MPLARQRARGYCALTPVFSSLMRGSTIPASVSARAVKPPSSLSNRNSQRLTHCLLACVYVLSGVLLFVTASLASATSLSRQLSRYPQPSQFLDPVFSSYGGNRRPVLCGADHKRMERKPRTRSWHASTTNASHFAGTDAAFLLHYCISSFLCARLAWTRRRRDQRAHLGHNPLRFGPETRPSGLVLHPVLSLTRTVFPLPPRATLASDGSASTRPRTLRTVQHRQQSASLPLDVYARRTVEGRGAADPSLGSCFG